MLAAESSVTCPHCGYDLRMIESDRCPECGQEIERGDAASQIPWEFRRTRGRLRAYLATVWMSTARPKSFKREMARPVSYRDARAFWRVNSTIVALLVMGGMTAAFVGNRGELELDPGYGPITNLMNSSAWARFAMFDLFLPCMMGLMFWPLTVLLAGVTVFTTLSLPAWFFASRELSTTERARAVSIAHYASGPIVWFPICLLANLGLVFVGTIVEANTRGDTEFMLMVAIVVVIGLLTVLPLLIVWARYVMLYVSLTRAGFVRGFAMAIGLPVAWLVNAVLWLVLVPWCVGIIWITYRAW